MSSSQWAQLLPGRNPLASLASCTSVLVLVSDLCHAPADSQSHVPSSLPPTPIPGKSISLVLERLSLVTGLLYWGQGKLLRARVWVFLSISVVPCWGYPLFTCCACLSRKNFPEEHQSDSKQKEGVAHLGQSSPGPGGFRAQGCPEAVWTHTRGCVYRNSTEAEGMVPRLCCRVLCTWPPPALLR